MLEDILGFCRTPKSKKEILEHFGYKDLKYFNMRYLKPLLGAGRLLETEDKKRSRNQKYLAVYSTARDDSKE